jgi:hypothetical protein
MSFFSKTKVNADANTAGFVSFQDSKFNEPVCYLSNYLVLESKNTTFYKIQYQRDANNCRFRVRLANDK